MKSNKKEIAVLSVLFLLLVSCFTLLAFAINKQFNILGDNFEKKDIKNNEIVKKEKEKDSVTQKISKNFIDEIVGKKYKNREPRKYIKSRTDLKYREQKRYVEPVGMYPHTSKKKKITGKKLIITDLSLKPLNSDVYDSVEKISPNVLKVKIGNNYGLIDDLGRYLLPVRYFDIKYFEEGFYIVSQIKDTSVSLLFDKDLKVKYASREIFEDSSYIFIKTVGEEDFYDVYDKTIAKIATIKSSTRPRVFCDEYFEVMDKSFRRKLVDKNNQLVISPIFDFFYAMKDSNGRNLLYVTIHPKTGVLTFDNQVIVPPVFNNVVQKTYNGNTIFEGCVKNKCAYFDENGKFVKNPKNMPFVKKSNVQFLTFDEITVMLNENK